jgi:hypothetical protein
MANLFSSRAWYNLVPDTNHVVVTSGYGTFENNSGTIGADTYLTAASTADGTLAIAYMPTVRTITVNLARFSGVVTVQWYDPSSGAYIPITGSPFSNTGTQNFTPPGNNRAGDTDWVLVLGTMIDPLTLSISLTTTNTATVTWPGYMLQQNSNLTTTNWVNVTNAITDVGSEYQAIGSPSAGQQYYRLKSGIGTPSLHIFLTATNTVALTWSGYMLQQNSNLTTTNWVNVTNAITVVGSEYQTIISPLVNQQFYRLKYL